MTNKINIDYEESTERYISAPHKKRLRRVARRVIRVATSKAAKHAAVVTAAGALVYGGAEAAFPDYEFKGDQTVQINELGEEDGTLREATFNHVDGVNGENIDETLQHIEDDPKNADVLGGTDGTTVHPGDEVHMPKEVVED